MRNRFLKDDLSLKESDSQSIAIIGISGRYPMANNLEEFWENLQQGKDCIAEIPKERWDYHQYSNSNKERKSKPSPKWGGFIDDIDKFDPLFFNISPKEAELMDPQERLFLETVWHTLEDAGYVTSDLEGEDVGVYVGTMWNQYQLLGVEESIKGNMIALRSIIASIANRVSYFFDFRGPSIALDTMCSSSLSAIYLACESINKGESKVAIAGGVNLSLHQSKYVALSADNFLSTDGRCRSFGEGGDGYVPGEGVGAVMLKSLSQAILDKDKIYGVIKGIFINHGGKTNGYTVPSLKGQEDLVSKALKKTNTNPHTISYIEAHGTGTSLGDPIEIKALTNAFRKFTAQNNYCALGSVKSNIGHLESAAGIAGLTKLVLQLKHHLLVPSIHSEIRNPYIQWENTPFYLQHSVTEWKSEPGVPRVAAMSSFGAGGANSHMIIEEYLPEEKSYKKNENFQTALFILSARTQERLQEYLKKYLEFFYKNKSINLEELIYTVQCCREAMEERIAILTNSIPSLVTTIEEILKGDNPVGVYRKSGIQSESIAVEDLKSSMNNQNWELLAQWWVNGEDIDWRGLYSQKQKPISLPNYPFLQRKTWFSTVSKLQEEKEMSLENLLNKSTKFTKNEVDQEFFYLPFWKQEPLNEQVFKETDVVIIAPEGFESFTKIFKSKAATRNIYEIYLGNYFQKEEHQRWRIRGDFPEDFAKVLSSIPEVQTIYFVGYTESLSLRDQFEQLAFAEKYGVMSLFYLIKALAASGRSMQFNLKVITHNVQALNDRDTINPLSAAIPGLTKVIAKEYLKTRVTLLDLDVAVYLQENNEWLLPMLQNESGAEQGMEIIYREGVRYVKRLQEHHLLAATNQNLPLKKNGVYWLLGGAGGIGVEISKYLAAEFQARVVWTGRRKLDAEIQSNIDLISSLGGEAIYFAGDLTNLQDMQKIHGEIKGRFGKINGVIHSAIVMKDRSINQMDDISFKMALDIKAKGSLVLNEVTKDEPLDFILFFSSSNSYSGNFGQGNYVAGCTFKDQFGLFLRKVRNCIVQIINWGYWGEVGIVSSAEYNARMTKMGVYSISIEDGITAMKQILASRIKQVVAIRISPELGIKLKILPSSPTAIREDRFLVNKSTMNSFIEMIGQIEKLVRFVWFKQFQSLGVFQRAEARYNKKELLKDLKILSKYTRLVDAILDSFQKEGFIEQVGELLIVREKINLLNGQFGSQDLLAIFQQKHQEFPEFSAYLNLLQESIIALPEILTGKLATTDVMFPNGSMHLVENIYKSNTIADIYNVEVKESIEEFLQFKIRENPQVQINILEVGAGTGGTSAEVLALINQYKDNLIYYYTDISKKFTEFGRLNYGHYPFVKFKTLNIEENITTQGFQSKTIDLILAVNVIHATKNISSSLKNLKNLLKPQGIIVINEGNYDNDFLTTTFGLLDGWWSFEDKENRIRHSPLLTSEKWVEILKREGFDDIVITGFQKENANTLYQSIILAKSTVPLLQFNSHTVDDLQDLLAPKNSIVENDFKVDSDFHRDEIKNKICEAVIKILGITRDELSLTKSFSEYGVDSIIVVDLINDINKIFDIKLKPTALFDYNNIYLLANHLYEDHQIRSNSLTVKESLHSGKKVEDLSYSMNLEGTNNTLPMAAWIEGPGEIDNIRILPVNLPEPDAHEICIDIKAFSLNFGDWLCVRGLYPTMPSYPFIPGFEISGVVRKVGRLVREFKVGDAVIALAGENLGGHAESLNINEKCAIKKPENISFAEACSLPVVFLTVYHSFEKAGLDPDDKILIQTAAGGIGLIAIQLAKLRGAEIYATVGSYEKVKYLNSIGITNVINYQHEDFKQKILELTAGYGVDVVLNTLSGDAIQRGLDILAPEGRYIEIAMTGLKTAKELRLSNLVQNQSFISVDLKRLIKSHPEKIKYYLERMVQMLIKGEIKPTIDRIFEFNQLKEAYLYLKDRKNIGKIVVQTSHNLSKDNPLSVNQHLITTEEVLFQSKNAANAKNDEYAVVGMSGRFPDADNLDEFWGNLASGKDSIKEVPKHRFDINKYFDPVVGKPHKTYVKTGGLLEHIDYFDPSFFNLSGKEAEFMDPQQRLFLEEAYKALEDAGYSDQALKDTKCGVFVGAVASDYYQLMQEKGIAPDVYTFTGNSASILASRISYFLDLKGYSIAVDTACSSSLIAVHLACQSLKAKECDMALAGGVFLMCTPNFYIMTSKVGMLSPDGKSKAFDDNANGFVPGEGVGVVVLKKLEKAIQDRDHIYGVIKSTASNQDGHTNGITAPNAISQTRLIKEAYAKAGISPENTNYIEAHGTGTALGDPIEVEALTNAFAEYTSKKNFCALGSLKTNIGHLATAAGIAGLIKVLLGLKHKQIPPSLNYDTPNRYISFAESPFYVNTKLNSWNRVLSNPRRAAISSFGFSGTNCHIIVEEPPSMEQQNKISILVPRIISFSAKTTKTLQQKILDFSSWLKKKGSLYDLSSISYTLNCGRNHFAFRLAFVCQSFSELVERIEEIINENFDLKINNIKPTNASRHLNRQVEQNIRKITDKYATSDSAKAMVDDLNNIAHLYLQGAEVDWQLLYQGENCQRISLPTYPFARESYWVATENLPKLSEPRQELQETSQTQVKLFNDSVEMTLQEILKKLRATLSQVLKLNLSNTSEHQSFGELGVDSLVGGEIIKAINEGFGLNISHTELFNYPTLNELATYVLKNLSENKPDSANNNTYFSAQHQDVSTDIAIIGISGQFPQANNLDEFWSLLKEGKTSITEIPYERWGFDKRNFEEYLAAGKINSKFGGFINTADQFDPLFFGISPKEAKLMDPQQRLCLEHCWNAIEDAGYSSKHLFNKNCGVFVGVSSNGYLEHVNDSLSTIGNALSILASRISYFMNLKGPCMPIDTACSSSLVSTHLAVRSLLNNECHLAIAAGVSVMLVSPNIYSFFNDSGMLSYDGKCKTFDQSADGFVPGEGVGVLVLKRLNEALHDRNHIYGVIKASAVNQDGRTAGITAPNGTAQAELIREVYKKYNIDPKTISYVEAHGTGTKLGDPIEVNAISQVYKETIMEKQYCPMGSVKTNIGHTLASAGIAGILKVLLAFKHQKIPASLNCSIPNELINFADSPFYINTKLSPWVADNNLPRRAVVSSFGFSGTNCHMVLEEAPPIEDMRAEQKPSFLITLSAKTKNSLKQKIQDFYAWVCKNANQAQLRDVSYTLNFGRTHFPSRIAVVVSNLEELKENLFQLINDRVPENSFVNFDGTNNSALSTALSALLKDTLKYISRPSQNIDKAEYIKKLLIIADLYTYGYEIEWEEDFYNKTDARLVSLPTYPFEKKSYWQQKVVSSSIDAPIRNQVTTNIEFNLKTYIAEVDRQILEHKCELPDVKQEELLAEYGCLSLLQVFQRMNVFQKGQEQYSVNELKEKLGIAPKYDRLFPALLKILDKQAFIKYTDDLVMTTELVGQTTSLDLQEKIDLIKADLLQSSPDVEGYLQLLDICFNSYPEILCGKVLATDIIFPSGSFSLVERIYKNNQVMDYFNQLLAKAIKIYVEQKIAARVSDEPIRILEVGAGVGGSSTFVLEALREYGEHIEYWYTDLSLGFMQHAKENFLPKYPFLKTKIFNMEKDPENQGLTPGSFNIILGANSIHATSLVDATIKHLRSLLKPNGLLLINELTKIQNYGTLVFGLTDGWWLFQDEKLRLPSSPLLSTDMWKRLLTENGFNKINFWTSPRQAFEEDSQHLILGVFAQDNQKKILEIQIQLKDILGLVLEIPPEEIDLTTPYSELGVDSILAVKIIEQINEKMNVKLEAIDLFNYSNIDILAKHLLKEPAAILHISANIVEKKTENQQATTNNSKDINNLQENQSQELTHPEQRDKEKVHDLLDQIKNRKINVADIYKNNNLTTKNW